MDKKILCPYCLVSEIDPAEAICQACYEKDDPLERRWWDNLRRKYPKEQIPAFTLGNKADEAFQTLENAEYKYREAGERKQADALLEQMNDFHRRRILCMLEVYRHVDLSPLPLETGLLEEYWAVLDRYARRLATEKEAWQAAQKLTGQLKRKKLTDEQLHLLPELNSFWGGEDVLDWSYSQYFEIAYGNLRNDIDAGTFMEILSRHFADVMAKPVERFEDH